ncbi:MAG: SDR family oxidoreductase [Myxococcales bacterium]|nr:MAG: SDR family oxidoreductase [Myxococcales bacterium]
MDFEDREGAALVVGGSGGIGAAIARLLAERGSDVIVGYRSNADAAERVVQEARAYGVNASLLHLDLGEDCSEAVSELDLHTLVYAAGPHVPMVHLSRVAPDDMTRQLSADAAAFFRVVHPALPSLRAYAGSIVAVTTAATDRFPVRDGLSSAPKAAVEAMVRALAVEEGRYGVRANSVGPGMLTDGMAERLISSGELDERALEITRGNIPLRRFGRAGDIAEAVCFLASDRAGFITGQKLSVDGGYGA